MESNIFIFILTFIAGLLTYRSMSGVNRRTLRVLGGGASGAGTGAILEGGATYSFFSSAYYGGMGISGYLFVLSFCFLCIIWIYNFIETRETTIL